MKAHVNLDLNRIIDQQMLLPTHAPIHMRTYRESCPRRLAEANQNSQMGTSIVYQHIPPSECHWPHLQVIFNSSSHSIFQELCRVSEVFLQILYSLVIILECCFCFHLLIE